MSATHDLGHDLGTPEAIPPGAGTEPLAPAPFLPPTAGTEPLSEAPATPVAPEPSEAAGDHEDGPVAYVAEVAAPEPAPAILPVTGGDAGTTALLGLGLVLAGACACVRAALS